MPVLLTFIVPTYNRAAHLRALLDVLRVELAGLEDEVAVIIGDNASTDETPDIVRDFAASRPGTRTLRHATNLGPDENFCRCIEACDSRYFWIFGDDDLPRAGLVGALVQLLERNSPDLVYINSRWSAALTNNDPDHPVQTLDAVRMDRITFARIVHVWTTFISGMVVRRELAPADTLRRFKGTNLVQLGWVLGALERGERFFQIRTPCVLATSGNTGGYRVLTVFGSHFQSVAKDALGGSDLARGMAKAMVARTSIAFLPRLVWSYREDRLGHFGRDESLADVLAPELQRSWVYVLFLRPIERAPRPLAWLALHGASLLARAVATWDMRFARASGRLVEPSA